MVRSLSLGVFKVEVLYIPLCNLRTRTLINLITKKKEQRKDKGKGTVTVCNWFFSYAEFKRGSSLSSLCLSVCVVLLWSICFLLEFCMVILFSFKCYDELVILDVLFFCMNIWWVEKLGSFWDTKWCSCTSVAVKYASAAVANSMFTIG